MIPEDTVQRILDATDIVQLVAEQIDLQRSGTSYKGLCPFHNEKTPSFNVDPNRARFHCFGCQAGGDAIDWLKEMNGMTFAEACGSLAARAGIYLADIDPGEYRKRPKPRVKIEKRPPPTLEDMDAGSPLDHERLAALRGLRTATVREAVSRGFLRFSTWGRKRSWIVTDKTRVNAQIRHLDGTRVFEKRKAQTVPGSWATWPLGVSTAKTPSILVTEGGPDFLAALEIILEFELQDQTSPVGVLGAGMPIHRNALAFLRGKRIHIARHNDQAGQVLVDTWQSQLGDTSSIETIVMPDDDLNDCLVKRGRLFTLSLFPYRSEVPF